MTNNTSKNTIAQDSMSGIFRMRITQVQNSAENISVCDPNTRSTSGISSCAPTSGGNNTATSSYKPTGLISACAPKNGK